MKRNEILEENEQIHLLHNRFPSNRESILAGSTSGFVAISLCHPFDTIRTRLQSSSATMSVSKCITGIIRNEGFYAFYKGFWPPFAAQGFYKSIVFSANTFARKSIFTGDGYMPIFPSGALSGAVNSVVVTPVELIRTRQMIIIGNGNRLSVYDGVLNILHRGGILGMWKGFLLTVLRDAPGLGLYFLSYEVCKSNSPLGPSNIWTKFISGSMAGVSYWLYALPMDTMKTHIQSQDTPKSNLREIWSAFQLLVSRDGIKRLYHTYPIALMRGIPSAAITLTSFDIMVDFMRKYDL
eukprot:gene887-1721_t